MSYLIDPKRKKPDDDDDDGSAVLELGYPTTHHDEKEREKKEDIIQNNQKGVEFVAPAINELNLYIADEKNEEDEEDYGPEL